MSDAVIVRAAGRDWTGEDRNLLRVRLDDETTTLKQVASEFGVNSGSLRRPYVRNLLGTHTKKKCHGGNNHRGKVPLPSNVHPLVRQLYRLVNMERATLKAVALKAGLNYRILSEWKKKANPGLANFDAALNVVGYRLTIEAIDAGKEPPKASVPKSTGKHGGTRPGAGRKSESAR